MDQSEIKLLKTSIENDVDFSKLQLSDAFFYSSLPICIVDAVFSIGVRYAGVQNTVQRFCDWAGWKCTDRTQNAKRKGHGIAEFLVKLECYSEEQLAQQVFANNQRTSTKSGILKAGAVRRFAARLSRNGIDDFADIEGADNAAKVEGARQDVKQIPGQKSGISFNYFQMLAGSDEHVKPDRMIIRYVSSALGKSVTADHARDLLLETTREIRAAYPENENITPRSIDHAIWQHQRSQG